MYEGLDKDDVSIAVAAELRGRLRGVMASGIEVSQTFDDWGNDFMRRVTWDRANPTVSLMIRGTTSLEDALSRLEVHDSTALVDCGLPLFNHLPADMLDRVRAVNVNVLEPGVQLDLQHVNPEITRVSLHGNQVATCTVRNARNLHGLWITTVASSLAPLVRSMRDLLPDTSNVRQIRVYGLESAAVNEMIDVADHVSPMCRYIIRVNAPDELRFLNHLTFIGATRVVLHVSDRRSDLAARMVQLLTQRTYSLFFSVKTYIPSPTVSRLLTVRAVYDAMEPSQRWLWYFIEYIV